jgi:hypothetical protein
MVGQSTQAANRNGNGQDIDTRDGEISASEQWRRELLRRGIEPIE